MRRLDNPMVYSQTPYMDYLDVFQALANDRRLQILEWLKDPEAHFKPQVDGDLVKDGVCAVLIAEKLHVSQPTLSEHMRILCQSKLVQAKRVKQWTFYKRNEGQIREFKKALKADL
jgi:DNA-binding transcriptional ArsR family regulator